MATAEERNRLLRALRRTRSDASELAVILFDRKVAVYLRTLRELVRRYRRRTTVTLSPAVERVLRAEARDHARLIVRSYNDELKRVITRNGDKNITAIRALIEEWAALRHASRADLVAVTETYGPHADATLSFFAENDLHPEFDFGGHGDATPVCPICLAIQKRNPHPFERVVAIGTPHPGCRQDWHPLAVTSSVLPPELSLGGALAGIVGKPTLIERSGSQSAAVDAIVRL